MQFTEKTVDEAISLGLAEMGLDESQAEIKVLEEPTKGLFGKLKGKAVVDIQKKKTGTEKAVDFLQKTLDIMEITAKATFNGDEENPVISVIAETSSSVIGYRGELLDALQVLASAVANIGKKDYKKVVVDCENYRNKREETLISLAHKLEGKATDMRREVVLEPMNPFERRIIHTALAESQTVTTKSEGSEPNRYVIIVPNDKDENSRPYIADRNNNRSRQANKNFKQKDRAGRKGFGNSSKGGRSDNRKPQEKKRTASYFGTYLGNSMKND